MGLGFFCFSLSHAVCLLVPLISCMMKYCLSCIWRIRWKGVLAYDQAEKKLWNWTYISTYSLAIYSNLLSFLKSGGHTPPWFLALSSVALLGRCWVPLLLDNLPGQGCSFPSRVAADWNLLDISPYSLPFFSWLKTGCMSASRKRSTNAWNRLSFS